MTIDSLIDTVLDREGGYVNHPADRGGGDPKARIAAAVARANGYGGPMRNFPLEQARALYRRLYWEAPRFDAIADLAPHLAAELFDSGVNMGSAVVAAFLQRALNALNRGATDYPDMPVQGERYVALAESRPANEAFLYGWLANRIG
jgi:lysozyme family protein